MKPQMVISRNNLKTDLDFFIDVFPCSARNVVPHIHAEGWYETAIVLSGNGYHFLEDSKTPVIKGDILIIQPGVCHLFLPTENIGEGDFSIINLLFKLDFLQKELCSDFSITAFSTLYQADFSDVKKIQAQSSETLNQKLQELLMEFNTAEAGRESMLQLLSAQFIGLLYRVYLNSLETHKPRQRDIVNKAILYINENFSRPLSINQLAAHCYVSRSYLCKLFVEVTQTTILQFIQQVRISNAMQLLVQTERKIADIGAASGYTNSTFFTHIFKKTAGLNPSDYRAKYSLLRK